MFPSLVPQQYFTQHSPRLVALYCILSNARLGFLFLQPLGQSWDMHAPARLASPFPVRAFELDGRLLGQPCWPTLQIMHGAKG